jgi:hypothetical protein
MKVLFQVSVSQIKAVSISVEVVSTAEAIYPTNYEAFHAGVCRSVFDAQKDGYSFPRGVYFQDVEIAQAQGFGYHNQSEWLEKDGESTCILITLLTIYSNNK